MSLTDIRIRPGLRAADFAERFQAEGCVQIPLFLEPQIAEAVARELDTLTYNIVASDEQDQTIVISDEVIRKFGADQARQFLGQTIKRAGLGFAFIHMSYALQDEFGRDPSKPIHRLTEFLQSRAFMDFGAEVIGETSIGSVHAQASWYRKGDFLTLHDDSHGRNDRAAAFTLGFTRRWRPDWGGQLLFHDADGNIERGYGPAFNVLTLFAVPKPHSVATVAAYAEEKRLSITGWLNRGA